MDAHTEIDIHTEHDARDIALCHEVNRILDKHYSGHLWLIGVNHSAGTINIELPYITRHRTRFPYGFALNIPSLGNPEIMEKKLMNAGGELLERYGLVRGPANQYSFSDAKKHGLDISGAKK